MQGKGVNKTSINVLPAFSVSLLLRCFLYLYRLTQTCDMRYVLGNPEMDDLAQVSYRPSQSHSLLTKLTQNKGIKATMPTEDKKEQLPCFFSNLPPELRTAIYTIVFEEEQDYNEYELCLNSAAHPALLQVCQLIRAEASEVFYKGRTFLLHIDNFKMEPQPQHWIWTKVAPDTLRIRNDGATDLPDVFGWLKRCHDGQLAGHNFMVDNLTEVMWMIRPAFMLVVSLRHAPWNRVEGELQKYMRAIGSPDFLPRHY